MKKLDLNGMSFGYLTVLNESKNVGKRGQIKWDCICVCGKINSVYSSNLTKKNGIVSCGCMTGKHRHTSGDKHSSEYNTWSSMKSRCNNVNSPDYVDYGGRGIKICDRWLHSFENFLEDMGKKPSKTHSLDRIDNNGNYEPFNCKWSTKYEQGRNQRTNKWIEFNGIKMITADWAYYFKINPCNLYTFIKKGRKIEDLYYYYLNKKNLTPLF